MKWVINYFISYNFNSKTCDVNYFNFVEPISPMIFFLQFN